VHDTPQENGVAEWLNCTLEKVCAMLHGTQLPKSLWEEESVHATWLKNQTSTKALEQVTPLWALTRTKPDLSKAHEWRRRVVVHDAANSKLGGQAKEGRRVGLDAESKASHIYWPDKMTISIECNTKFDKDYILVLSRPPSDDPAPAKPSASP